MARVPDESGPRANLFVSRRMLGGLRLFAGSSRWWLRHGLRDLMGVCLDPKGFTREVNRELRRIWEASTGSDPRAKEKSAEVDRKIGNIRRSIEDGMPDPTWAYARMRELLEEKHRLEAASAITENPPQIDTEAALAYRRQTERVLANADSSQRKLILRSWVDQIQLAPESLEVEVNYRIPEPVVNSMGAGVGFEPTTFGL